MNSSNHTNKLTPLSRRQRQCLSATASGLPAKAVARQLGISERMVRWHLESARQRLGAGSTAQAVYLAAKLELID
jgi:DNA-binding CsgD family transcriptional regulator